MKINHAWIVGTVFFVGAFGLIQSSFYDEDQEMISFMDPKNQANGERVVVHTIFDLLNNQPELQQQFVDIIKSNNYTLSSIINMALNQLDQTALHLLALKGDISRMKEFIFEGVDINAQDVKGWTPLHCAVLSKSPIAIATVVLLVESGADLQAKSKSGKTPLDIASKFNSLPEILEYLEVAGQEKEQGFQPIQE